VAMVLRVWLENNEVDIDVNKQTILRRTIITTLRNTRRTRHQNQNCSITRIHRQGAKYPNQGTVRSMAQQRSGSGAKATTSDARGYGQVQVAEALEDLRRATSVVAGAVRVPWVVLKGRKRACIQLPGPGEPELRLA